MTNGKQRGGGVLGRFKEMLGFSEPLEQAEPVEQATPARSRAMRSRSPRQPGNETFSVVGNASGEPMAGPFNTMGEASA